MIITMHNEFGVQVATFNTDNYTSEAKLCQDIRKVLAEEALASLTKGAKQ